MQEGTVQYWHERGYRLDDSILDAPGKLLNTAGNPYYISDVVEPWYVGHEVQTISSRYIVGKKLGRILNRSELIRFKSEDKKDFRLENLILHSKIATANELYRVNGPPIYGYSHCMCKCGEPLDIERQKDHPHAFVEGHRPNAIVQKKAQALALEVPRGKRRHKKKPSHKEKDTTPLPSTQELIEETTTPIPTGPPEELQSFRPLFENMIHHLPWKHFKQVLELLMDISLKNK